MRFQSCCRQERCGRWVASCVGVRMASSPATPLSARLARRGSLPTLPPRPPATTPPPAARRVSPPRARPTAWPASRPSRRWTASPSPCCQRRGCPQLPVTPLGERAAGPPLARPVPRATSSRTAAAWGRATPCTSRERAGASLAMAPVRHARRKPSTTAPGGYPDIVFRNSQITHCTRWVS